MGEKEGNKVATPNNTKLNWTVLVWPFFYIVVLVALPIFRNAFAGSLPHYILYPFQNMPLSVLWFGTLGGLLVSLYSIITNKEWSGPFSLWHMFSGMLGALYGLISYLLIVVLINAVTISNNFDRNSVAFDVFAFLFGFGQSTFQGMLKRFTRSAFGNRSGDDA